MDEYIVPTLPAQEEFCEKRSRFIGHIFPVETEKEALAALERVRKEYWDANHNVFAYVLHGGAVRFSDDSEPQGTAGMPVLNVLFGAKAENVLCVVTRYFGGVLLGTGGLVRAYTKAAQLALGSASLSLKRLWQEVTIPCPYALFESVQRCVAENGGEVSGTEYGAEVVLSAAFPKTQTDRFFERLTDLTCGKVTGSVTGEAYKAFPVRKEEKP